MNRARESPERGTEDLEPIFISPTSLTCCGLSGGAGAAMASGDSELDTSNSRVSENGFFFVLQNSIELLILVQGRNTS
jgi:hypothetical protein